jgi:transcriptional regulator with XRE-family HTH domain
MYMRKMGMSKARIKYLKGLKLPPIAEEDRGVCLSQKEIAARLGVSRTRVGQIEIVAMRKLLKLAQERGLNLEEIAGR